MTWMSDVSGLNRFYMMCSFLKFEATIFFPKYLFGGIAKVLCMCMW